MNLSTTNVSETPPQNPLFLELKDAAAAGFQPKLFAPALIYALLASVGIPLNFSVCYITLKFRSEYRTLGSPTGILLAVNSFFELLHQSSHFCFLAVTASGTNFIPAQVAFRWEFLASFGFVATTRLLFSLGVDRLFAVASPVRYRNMPKCVYIYLHLALICCGVSVSIYYEFLAVQQSPDWPVTGFISDLFTVPSQFSYGMIIGAIHAGLTVACYLLVALMVNCRRKEVANASSSTRNHRNHESLRRLYRSLALIVGINIGSYLLGYLMHFILFHFVNLTGWTDSDIWLYLALSGLFMNVSAVANAPILIANSSEYSAAYHREWLSIRRWLLFKMCCPKRIAAENNGNKIVTTGMLQVLPAPSHSHFITT